MEFSFEGGEIKITISPSALEMIAKEFKYQADQTLKAGSKNFTLMQKPISKDKKWSLLFSWKPEFDEEGNVTNY